MTLAWLRALIEKASPGPWRVVDRGVPGKRVIECDSPERPRADRRIASFDIWRRKDTNDPNEVFTDVEAVVALRNAAPALLDAVEYAQALVALLDSPWESVPDMEAAQVHATDTLRTALTRIGGAS